MTKRAILNTFSATSLLLSACSTVTPEAPSEPEIEIVSLDDLAVGSETSTTAIEELNFKVLGMPDEISADRVLLGWPGSGVETRFEGSQLFATINGTSDTYVQVQINDVSKVIQLQDGRFVYRLIDAAPGTYDVSLQIRTDRAYRPISFEGFTSTDGNITAPARSDLQLLVIGDDVATGFGVEGEDRFCTYSRATQNATLTYANLTGQNLDADVAVIAKSGRGLTKNWDGDPSRTMVELYKSIADSNTARALGEMDAVIVQIGAMDVAQSDLEPEFKSAYATFLNDIREDNPSSEIVAAWGPMGSGDRYAAAKEAISAVVSERASAGDNKVSFIELSNAELGQVYGCDWHPGASSQRFMATSLTNHLAERLDIEVEDELLGG